MSDLLVILCVGLVAGVMGGLLGLGGGILLMPLLRFGFGLPPDLAVGTCVLAVFFSTLGGAYRHYRLGNVRLARILPIVAACAVSAVGASLLFARVAAHGRVLDLALSLVFLLVAARMLFDALIVPRTRPFVDEELGGRLPARLGIGAVAGTLPGLLGVGTGAILVPVFVLLLRTPVRLAIGTSLVCFAVSALISAAFKMGQGYIDLQLAAPACVGTLIGANLGALLNGRLSSKTLKLVFGAVFACVSAKFILSGL